MTYYPINVNLSFHCKSTVCDEPDWLVRIRSVSVAHARVLAVNLEGPGTPQNCPRCGCMGEMVGE